MNQATLTGRPILYILWIGRKLNILIPNSRYEAFLHTDLPIQWMSRGDIVENLPGISKVEALGSTDEGVSFALTLPDGKKLFHAGDLNCWHGEEEQYPGEVKRPVNLFETQIDRIATLYTEFDVIFFLSMPPGRDTAMGAANSSTKIR